MKQYTTLRIIYSFYILLLCLFQHDVRRISFYIEPRRAPEEIDETNGRKID